MFFENFLLSWWVWFACFTTAASILVSVCFLNGFFKGRSAPSVRQDADLAATQEDKREPSVSTPSGFDYEVFLSFRGSDTRKGFTDFLYNSLIDAGVRAFRDNEELRVGEEIGPDLLQAISNSKISIPIFSRDYASSKWCLKEVAQMVKCRDQRKQMIFPIFYDVTPHDVRHQTGPFAKAFSQHMKRYNLKTVQEWRDALNEIGALKGWEPKNVADGHEGQLAKMVVSKVLTELKKAYLVITKYLVGVDDHVEEVMKLLEVGTRDVRIVGICGIGGIGKTTIAKVIYNQLLECFEHHSFLKDIRENSRQKGLEYLQSVLVSDILNRERPDFSCTDEGIKELGQRLRNKKVLIVLDDVDHKSQLNVLVGELEWFAPGSRIIITTRNKDILNLPQVGGMYEVSEIHPDQALLLFCRHAFRSHASTADFSSLSRSIVETTRGLPLAIEVIASFLSGKRKKIWEDTLKKLQKTPEKEVQEKLKISYDALDHEQQQMFLDIACLFIGTDSRIAVHMWEDCDFFPEAGIEVLRLMSLVKVGDNNKFWMHDQLRDLGREIVRQENYKEPGKRSRLWCSEEAIDVLQGLQGTGEVEAICLDCVIGVEDNCFTNEQFSSLSNLRFLQLNYANIAGNFRLLLSKLRWLCWHGCPSDFLPTNLNLKKMVILDLSSSMITYDWEGWSAMQISVKLKVLNLTRCLHLTRTPVFSTFPSLERLILKDCRSLIVIDPSIVQLKSLVYLNVKNCSSLEKLPQELGSMGALRELCVDGTHIKEITISKGMKNLEILSAKKCDALTQIHVLLGKRNFLRKLVLDLTKIEELPDSIRCLIKLTCLSLNYCSLLTKLPDSIGQLTSLVEMSLSYTGIGTLPESVGSLGKLEVLNIDDSHIKDLPGTIGMLQNLKVINASGCNCLNGEIPPNIGMLSFLKILRLDGTNINLLPGSISELSHLETLDLTECQELQFLPELPSSIAYLYFTCKSMVCFPHLSDLINLKELSIEKCVELKELSGGISRLTKLEKLTVSRTKIIMLPEEIGSLPRLKELVIRYCIELKYIPKLPSSLYKVRIVYCSSYEKLPNLANLSRLSQLSLYGSSELTEIQGLGDLVSLTSLEVFECPKLSKLDGLEKLKPLKNLDVADCKSLDRLPDLSMLTELRRLVAYGCEKLMEIEGLDGLESLMYLEMNDCISLEVLSNLSNLKKLTSLRLAGCDNLVEIEGLDGLDRLEILSMDECTSIGALSDLSNLKKLRSLDLEGCESLREIEGLEELESLELLNISRCRAIEKLPNLSKLQKLEELLMCDCDKVMEIQGLEELKSLRRLNILRCTVLQNVPDLPNVDIKR